VRALKAALDLRPDYYDAHRELAYCYHLLDDIAAARREYSLADANRGGATDAKEVAGLNLALADLYRRTAAASDDAMKQQCLAAANGYLADAREITPDLQGALDTLTAAGLKSHLTLSSLVPDPEDRPRAPAPQQDLAPMVKDANPGSQPAPGPAATTGDVNQFDLSGFPHELTSFEEQQVQEAIQSATTPALKADAHARLARYYEKRNDASRARSERAKADYWRSGGKL
jgi:hypothetical protein